MKHIISLIFIIISHGLNAQLSISVLSVIENSSSYTFIGVTYKPDTYLFKPDYNTLSDVLNTLDQRYEAAHKLCSYEYSKLQKLKLLNRDNILILQKHQTEVAQWAKVNFKKMNLADDRIKSSVLEFITKVYKVESIRNEIILLQSINNSLKILSESDFTDWCKKRAYKDMQSFIDGIKTYQASQLLLDYSELLRLHFRTLDNKIAQESELLRIKLFDEYAKVKIFKVVPNGWVDATLLSLGRSSTYAGIEYYIIYETKVLVQDNKVTMILNSDGSAQTIKHSANISQQRVDIIISEEECNGNRTDIPYTVYIK